MHLFIYLLSISIKRWVTQKARQPVQGGPKKKTRNNKYTDANKTKYKTKQGTVTKKQNC